MSKNKGCGVARFGGMGDNLIVTSAFPGLRERYGYLEVLTQLPHGVVFENNPHVDRVIYKEPGDFPANDAEAWQRWFVNRGKEYESFHHLSHTCEFRAAMFPGQGDFWAAASFRRKYYGMNYLEVVHDRCELPYNPIGPGYFPSRDEVERAMSDRREKILKGRDGPLIGWVCSGSRIDKRHPRAGIAVARIIRELDATVLAFGAWGTDVLVLQEIEKQVKQYLGSLDRFGFCANTSEKDETWPMRRSLAQIRQCDLVVTPDTGPQWAVASLPMPKIVLLSHASPENITKYAVNTTTLVAERERVACWPCHRLHNDFTTCTPNADNDGPACMTDISVEAIVRAAEMWLTDATRAREAIARPLTSGELLLAVSAPTSGGAEILNFGT